MTLSSVISLNELMSLAGKEIGVSDWMPIPQSRIDHFADVIEDHQFIHVDPVAAARTPLGGPIAHGFLTLSLLSQMSYQVIPKLENLTMGINYGFDKIRFLSPVPAGSEVRGRFTLISAEERKPNEILIRLSVTVEIHGADKPALAAEWLTLQAVGP